jgi:hypothetical protein
LEESSEKPKRGRPRVIPADWERALTPTGIFIDCNSDRAKQNIFYRSQALRVLGYGKDPMFSWLADIEGMRTNEPKSLRSSILAELGRIQDEETLRAVALQICELKPKARDASAMIRDARRGKPTVVNADEIADELINCVNSLMRRKRATPWAQVIKALEITIRSVRETAESEGDSEIAKP